MSECSIVGISLSAHSLGRGTGGRNHNERSTRYIAFLSAALGTAIPNISRQTEWLSRAAEARTDWEDCWELDMISWARRPRDWAVRCWRSVKYPVMAIWRALSSLVESMCQVNLTYATTLQASDGQCLSRVMGKLFSVPYLLNKALRRTTSSESRNDALTAVSGRTAASNSVAVGGLNIDKYTKASLSCVASNNRRGQTRKSCIELAICTVHTLGMYSSRECGLAAMTLCNTDAKPAWELGAFLNTTRESTMSRISARTNSHSLNVLTRMLAPRAATLSLDVFPKPEEARYTQYYIWSRLQNSHQRTRPYARQRKMAHNTPQTGTG